MHGITKKKKKKESLKRLIQTGQISVFLVIELLQSWENHHGRHILERGKS